MQSSADWTPPAPLTDAENLRWIRDNCRVVFCFEDALKYPLEHCLPAKKDQWEAILANAKR